MNMEKKNIIGCNLKWSFSAGVDFSPQRTFDSDWKRSENQRRKGKI